MTALKCWPLALVLAVAGCARSSPAAPSAAVVVSLPLALAGQSNADFIRPALQAAYAPASVIGYAQGGSTIAQWQIGAPAGFWSLLTPSLHQPLRAFVWWQGESDTTDVNYLTDLTEFVTRVRKETGNPTLLVLICRVVDDPAFQGIRQIQQKYVDSDKFAVLVSSDGLPLEDPTPGAGSAHLSAAGYVAMSARILGALP